MKILLAEDDPNSMMILERILSLYGSCDRAKDGEEALEFFKIAHRKHEPYQLICLDIMMPILDGQEVLKKIRDLEVELDMPQCVVWMTTALDGASDKIEAIYKGGCNAYITKPYKREVIEKHLINHGFVKP